MHTTYNLYITKGYRFGFQGQEKENEIYGEGNASFYKYRISDNRLGRFFAVDPLAAKYPYNSPYAFSENRVIDGIELEGLEYLDKDKSRVRIASGELHLKISNFNETTKNLWVHAVQNPNNWTVNPQTGQRDQGISTKLTDIDFIIPEKSPLITIDNGYGETRSTVNPYRVETKGYNRDAKRLIKRKGPNIINTASSRSIGLSRGVLLLNVINYAFQKYIDVSATEDDELVKLHAEYAHNALRDVSYALKNTKLIPPKYHNKQSLTQIANVVLQGENISGNSDIYNIGMSIYNNISLKPYLYAVPTTTSPNKYNPNSDNTRYVRKDIIIKEQNP